MTILHSTNFDADTGGAIAPGWVAKIGAWAVGTNSPVSGAKSFGATSDADGNVALYTGATATADMQIDTACKLVDSGGKLPVISHILRSDAANANHYAALFSSVGPTGFSIIFFKKSGGSYSGLNGSFGTAISMTLAAGDTLRIRTKIVGSTISVYVGRNAEPGATPVATVSDSGVTAPGYPGLYYSKDGATTPMTIDDFALDNLAAAAPSDTTAPTFASAQVANAQPSVIAVTFNEALAGSVPPTSAFAVSGGRTVTGVSVAGSVASVTVSAPYAQGDAVGIAYTKPGANPRLQDAAGNPVESFGSQPVTNNVAATSNNALANGTGNVRFSPYNWDIQASTAKTINAGAYFKAIFGGTSCTLNFDMTGIASPLPQISYRVDRFGPWISVPIAASVAITIPADTVDYANKPGHLLEVLVKSMTETQARWSTQSTAVKLTGVILDTGKILSAPPALPLKAIFYGDSITEGVRTVNMTGASDTDRNDAGQGWSLEVGRLLGAEVGNVGFGATGFNNGGSGGVPALPNSYNLLYAGVARSFASSPDFIVLMQGTNDGGDVTANATAVLNGLLSATAAKIILLRPFDGIAPGNGTAHATQLQAARAACSAPARVTYVDTSGWFTTSNASDSLHPYGVENITHIAPLAAAAIKSALATGASLSQRTVSITLGLDATTAAANLSGARVAFYDEPTPDLYTVARFQTAAETCDANGVLTFQCGSTLPSGGTGGFVVQFADGKHYNGQVQVS